MKRERPAIPAEKRGTNWECPHEHKEATMDDMGPADEDLFLNGEDEETYTTASGRVMTAADIEALVDEYHAGCRPMPKTRRGLIDGIRAAFNRGRTSGLLGGHR